MATVRIEHNGSNAVHSLARSCDEDVLGPGGLATSIRVLKVVVSTDKIRSDRSKMIPPSSATSTAWLRELPSEFNQHDLASTTVEASPICLSM